MEGESQLKQALIYNVAYAGRVKVDESSGKIKGARAKVIRDGVVFTRYFSVDSHEHPMRAANKYRRIMSDKLGLSRTRPTVPEEVQRFIAGFLDGDGSVESHIRRNGTSASVSVRFTQCQSKGIPEVLTFISKYYPGAKFYSNRHVESSPTRRIKHDIQFFGYNAVWLLRDLANKAIIKRRQIDTALSLVKSSDRHTKVLLHREMQAAKETAALMHIDVQSDDERLTDSYIAGLFDAEGCIRVRNAHRSISVKLSQHSCIPILWAIMGKLEISTNSPNNGYLEFGGLSAAKFLESVRRYLLMKRQQADLCIKFYFDATSAEAEEIRYLMPILKRQ